MCLNGGECLKTAAGHQCDCSFGYTGVNCAIAGDDDAVTGEDKIFLTDITARKVYVAVLGIYTFTALNEDDDPIEAWDIAFDETKQKLYWTNKTDNKIYRGNWDMTERIPVSHGNYSDPTSISIDESRGQIYCAYLGDQVITRIDLDDPDSEINLFGQLTRPSAVELDETNGYLYFTQTGRVYRWNYISESNYDKLYSNYPDVNDIDAIAIEVPANRLSVCDYGNAKVITMDLNGNDPKEVAILSDYKISDILLYKGAYYMSHSGAEDGQMTLLKYALDSESLLNVFNDSDHLFGDVKKIQVANVAMLSLN
ncbi:low-density lipoprotein receptor-like [Strongylocentrotus purpuratus]|uniref:EGF-like domain-containing protein n=1 Tax=Strongylocentrotus purpuratus TaxID=7668 RepID=A0A7M7NSN4_STRPU|nr:low-density lipoprotein receptor-like [Strongylocentrotus purpuratus]